VRHFACALLLSATLLPLSGATLERLSLSDLVTKSNAIVRGKVQSSSAAFRGRMIFTHYSVAVSEELKGSGGSTVDVAVPGGTANGIVQNFSGTPTFQVGDEFVFFLWSDKTGLNWITGLTQGLFSVAQDSPSNPTLTRKATHEMMLDPATHQPVQDQDFSISLADLRSQIASILGVSK